MTKEIKAILLTMAKQQSNCDGVYPTVSSHGDRHEELEQELKYTYEELVANYENSLIELEYIVEG